MNGRLAVAAARKLKVADLEAAIANLVRLAQGEGHVAVNAIRTLHSIASGTETGDDLANRDEFDPARMTPEQRATALTVIRKALAKVRQEEAEAHRASDGSIRPLPLPTLAPNEPLLRRFHPRALTPRTPTLALPAVWLVVAALVAVVLLVVGMTGGPIESIDET